MADSLPKERKRRPTPPLTSGWLRSEAALHLQRWPASETRIRRLMWDRVKRAQSFHGGTKDAAAVLVNEAIVSLISATLIDDARFARLWVVSLRRRGTSSRMIRQKLREKGVDSSHIDEALAAWVSDEGGDPERSSALAYAKRRRLGPFRKPYDDSWEGKRKDMATLARVGFSFGIAQEIIESSPK
jgi:regulatory protein